MTMKVLVAHPGPHFSVADVYRGIVTGLRANGVEVGDFNLDKRLDFYANAMLEVNGELRHAFEYEAACTMASKGIEVVCYEWWPDVVIIVSGFFLPPELYDLIRSRRHHLVLWLTESPYEDERQLLQASRADTVIINDPTNIDAFRQHNPRTFYIPHGYDPAVHYVGDGETSWDFAFVGTGYPSRIGFFEQVDWTGLNATFAGNWAHVTDDSPLASLLMHERGECIDNRDAAELYRRTKMSANLYRREAEAEHLVHGWAMGPREVELAACGTFFLREPRGESDEVLGMLPSFTSTAEFNDLLRWWLRHDTLRVDLARKAREAVANRSFAHTTAQLLRIIGVA